MQCSADKLRIRQVCADADADVGMSLGQLGQWWWCCCSLCFTTEVEHFRSRSLNDSRYMGAVSAAATLTNSLSDLTNTLAAKCHCHTHTHTLLSHFFSSCCCCVDMHVIRASFGKAISHAALLMTRLTTDEQRQTTEQRLLFADKQHYSGLLTNNVNYQRLYTSLSCRIITQHLPLQQICTFFLPLNSFFFFVSSLLRMCLSISILSAMQIRIAWLDQSCCLLSTDFAFYSFVETLSPEAIAIHSSHFYYSCCVRDIYVYMPVFSLRPACGSSGCVSVFVYAC